MKVIIMQGQPGAGKSTYLRNQHPEAKICSANDFFTDITGNYKFYASGIREAHNQCIRDFLFLVQKKENHVAVDNTNVKLWELSTFVHIGAALGFDVHVIRCVCSFETALSRVQYDISKKAVKVMTNTMERPLEFWPCSYTEIPTE